jgi:hypothetical protein
LRTVKMVVPCQTGCSDGDACMETSGWFQI